MHGDNSCFSFANADIISKSVCYVSIFRTNFSFLVIFEDDRENRVFNADCRTPDRRPGRCIRLTSCTALRQGVSRNRLRRYFCGFEGDEPKVCCPRPRDEVTPPRPVIRTTARPTTRATPRTTVRPTIRTTRRPTPRTTVRSEEARNGGQPFGITPRPRPDSLTKPPFLPQCKYDVWIEL